MDTVSAHATDFVASVDVHAVSSTRKHTHKSTPVRIQDSSSFSMTFSFESTLNPCWVSNIHSIKQKPSFQVDLKVLVGHLHERRESQGGNPTEKTLIPGIQFGS